MTARPALVRAIGRHDLLAAVVNAVIGSSIFGMPGEVAALTGAWSPLAYVLAAAGVLTIVLCFAEVASRFDEPGGPYLYTRSAFGPAAGFQAGWLTLFVRASAVAANLNVLVAYLAQVLPAAGSAEGRVAVMAAVLGVLALLNVRGVRQATWTIDALTVLKLLPLLVLAILALPRVDPAVLASQQVAAPDWPAALLLLVYAYGGFEAPLMAAGEARAPRRDSAFALFGALAVIAVVYLLVQLAVVGVVPEVASSKAPVAAAFERLMGPAGVALASLAATVSILAWALGTVLQAPRLVLAMADRGELPGALAAVHPRFRTPHRAIAAFALLALGLALLGSFRGNATLSALVRLITYGLTCAALPVLRRRGEVPGFHLPAASLIVPLALGFCAWLLVSRSLQQWWLLPALMLVGEAVRRLCRR